MKPLTNKTDWSLYSTILLIIICIQGSLQHSQRREIYDDSRVDSVQDRRMEMKDRRTNGEPALNVLQHVQDVRADSRRSRIDAQDIRTDFREIRTELGGRRDSRGFQRISDFSTSRIDIKRKIQDDRREKQITDARLNERQSEQSTHHRTDSRDNLRRSVESRLDRMKKTSALDRQPQERGNSRNDLFSRRFTAERTESRFNQRISQEPSTRQEKTISARESRLIRLARSETRLNTRENIRHQQSSETRINRRIQERFDSRDEVKDNNQRRQNPTFERFVTMKISPLERRETKLTRFVDRRTFRNQWTNRELIEIRERRTYQGDERHRSGKQESRDHRDKTRGLSISPEDRTRGSLNEVRGTQQSSSASAESSHQNSDRARVSSTHRVIARSSDNIERDTVRSKPSSVREMRNGFIDNERIGNQLTIKSQKGFPILQTVLPSQLKNNSDVFVSTIQATLVLFLVLQMIGDKTKKQFGFHTWTSPFSHVKSA